MAQSFKFFAISLLLAAIAVSGISHPLNVFKLSLNTIIIDAGHGGKDVGCQSHDKTVMEKDISLALALKLGAMLKDSLPNINIIYTRNKDVFVPLWKRAEIANKHNADLFISVHCNASHSKAPKGTETYVMGLHKTEKNLSVSKRENSSIKLEHDYQSNEKYGGFDPESDEGHIILSLYQNAYRNQSLNLAAEFQSQVGVNTLRRNRGVKEAGFVVLWKTAMPSILVESGFLTNEEDKNYLNSEKGQNELVENIVQSVDKYKEQLDEMYSQD